MFISFVQWRCSSRKVQKLKKIMWLHLKMFVNFLPSYEKRYRCPVLSFLKFSLHFIFLPLFISHLSGNKLRNLPQGIFKGLKRLLIMWVEYEVHFELNLIELVSQYLLIIALISLRSTYQCTKIISAVLLIVFFSSVFRKRTLWKRTEERFHWQLPRNQAVKNSVSV